MDFIKGSIVIGLIVLLTALVPAAAEEFQPARPIDGQKWRVEVRYPSALGDGSWSDPEVWRYETRKAEEGWVISATAGGAGENADRIEIRTDDAFEVREIRIYRETGQAGRERILRPGPGEPVLTERSPAPFDRPVFPLKVPSTNTYRRMITLGSGLQAETGVIQTVRRVIEDGIPAVPPGSASPEGGVIEVTLSDPRGAVLAVQYWSEGFPWPLSGSNRSMRYQLVGTGE